jgi:multiple sugar transport system substrate-binding protein/sn-glycerol 3-phosphate transport system substrate-binding protein
LKISPSQSIPIILCLAILLSACGGTPTARPEEQTPTGTPERTPLVQPTASVEATTAPQPTSAFSETGTSLAGLRVHLWHPWTGATAAEMQRLETDFNGTNPWGIWVEVSGYPGVDAIDTAMDAQWEKDDPPEVVIATTAQALVWDSAHRSLVDLAPYIADAEWGMPAADQADFLAVFWDAQVDGPRRVGIPALGTAQVLFYNQTWASELGFDSPPTTPDELQKQACAAAFANQNDNDLENDGTGGWLIDSSPANIASWLLAYNAPLTPADGQGYRFANAESEAAFGYVKGAYDKGCFWVGRQPDPFTYLARRNALLVAGSLNAGDELTRALTGEKSQDAWTVLPFPGSSADPRLLATSTSYHVFSGSPEEQLAAWLVVRWMSQADVQVRLARHGWDYPTRTTAMNAMLDQAGVPDPWKQGAGLLSGAVAEPADAHWSMARRVLQDAFRQLFQADTKPNQIPEILQNVDLLLADLEGPQP